MESRPATPTPVIQMEAIHSKKIIIIEPQLLQLKQSRRFQKGFLRLVLNQAFDLLGSQDTTLEAPAKLEQQSKVKYHEMSKKNEECGASSKRNTDDKTKVPIRQFPSPATYYRLQNTLQNWIWNERLLMSGETSCREFRL